MPSVSIYPVIMLTHPELPLWMPQHIKVTSDGEHLHLHVKNQPAVNLSSVFITASNLLTPPQQGLHQKSISGIFHSQEWDHFCGFICMVFGKDELHAQLEKDSLLFSMAGK